jgi:DNA-binding SARP family transcriptional activator
MMLEIHLLGNLGLWRDGIALPVKTQAMAELLCYLVLHPKALRRESVASDLWGEQTTTGNALKKLRQQLWVLRSWLSEHQLHEMKLHECENHDSLQLEVAANVKIDVYQLHDAGRLLNLGLAIQESQLMVFEQATLMAGHELLEGNRAEWVLQERERYRDLMGSILERLIAVCQERGCWDKAREYLQKALQLEPTRESVHYQAIDLHAKQGDVVGAIRQFERCAKALKEAFGVEPCAATRALLNFNTPASVSGSSHQNLLEMVVRIQQTLADLLCRFEKI